MMGDVRAVIWIVEGTWQGCIDSATEMLPPDAEVTVLHVTSTDAAAAAEGASAGLLGRGRFAHRPHHSMEHVAAQEASELLDAAVERLGRDGSERLELTGDRVEQTVVRALAGADLLIAARDGDRSRLGPHSLGHVTRFVVDHAPCSVLLVWPDEPPAISSIPPPPPHPPH